MLVDVVPIRQAGRSLEGRELGPAVRGDLAVRLGGDDVQPEWRHALRARLCVQAGGVSSGLPDLVDVRLLSIIDGVIRLIGIELGEEPTADHLVDSVVERMQIWRCHIVPPPDATCEYQVLRLRQSGRRLRRQDLPAAVSGDLCVVAGHGPESSYRREGLSAELYTTRGANCVRVGALLPIFDVRLLDLHGDRIMLVGIELASTHNADRAEWTVTESVQIWHCTLMQSATGELRGVSATERAPAATRPTTDTAPACEGSRRDLVEVAGP